MSALQFEAASWLPCPNSPEEHQAGVDAVTRWVRQQERRTGARSVLLTDTFGVDDEISAIGPYQRGSTYFSARNGGPATRGPVLVYRPTRRLLKVAQGMALSAICVWELVPPVLGWAGQVHALNLSTGQTTVPHPALADHLDRLVWAGNNGYHDKPGRRDARRILGEIADQGLLDQDISSALAAHGLSTSALDNVDKFITSLSTRKGLVI
ncbi:hypothetical protein [Actinophytocola glycyrrhizae]|uniref:Uncharacterized protein n=1 Tax=Actinophytocola glycyrrhizae TaxID=2044873 RepID=A0ABV9SG50_9PSEU